MMTMTRFANDESLLIQAQNGDSEAAELYLFCVCSVFKYDS